MAPKTKDDITDRLIGLIEADHRVIEANTVTSAHLADVISSLEKAVTLLVTQVTASISQQREGVPIKTHLITVIILAAALAIVIGLDAANVFHFGGAP